MLVDYSSSSGDEEDDLHKTQINQSISDKKSSCLSGNVEKNGMGKAPLPSVPTDIINMFGSSNEASYQDEPEQHGGRVRAFAHERGNWATHVYIPYNDESNNLTDFIHGLLHCVDSGWKPVDDFHVSLSRTFPIRYHWIDGLYKSLHSSVRGNRFRITFSGYKIYSNDERTRSFLGLNVLNGRQTLVNLVGQVDRCLEEFRLPLYYTEPEFHLSLIWCLGDVRETLSSHQRRNLQEYASSHAEDLGFTAAQALMKTGNRVYNLPFT